MKIRPARRISYLYLKIVTAIALVMTLSVMTATLWLKESNDVEFQHAKTREPASDEAPLPFVPVSLLTGAEAYGRTGIEGGRGRVVVFRPEAFVVDPRTKAGSRFWNNPERVIGFNLFDDAFIHVRLQRPSQFGVNYEIYAGVVEDDPESRVRLQVTGRILDGTIATSGFEYRIVDGGNGQHIIVETRRPRPR